MGGTETAGSTATAPALTLDMDVLRALQAFLDAQRQRAEQYHMMDAAHCAYCASGAEGPYRYAMGQATQSFQTCSQAVRHCWIGDCRLRRAARSTLHVAAASR